MPPARMRRKREVLLDDSSVSMCSDPLAIEASSLSQADSSRTSRACRHPKRRRTIVDALQNISLNTSTPQEVEIDDDCSLLAGGPVSGDDHSLTSDSDDEQLLTEAEKAQRQVMLELVLGGGQSKAQPPSNPVDARVEEMIRESLRRAVSGDLPFAQDDLTIDTCYSRSTPSSEFEFLEPNRPRSNSLPDHNNRYDSERMDLDA